MREILQRQYVDKGQLYVDIPETCTICDFTSPTYYNLRKQGLGPKETRFPGTRIVRIAVEELDRWLSARDRPSKAMRAAIDEQQQKAKAASAAANSRQLHKLNHKAKNGDAADDTPPDIPRKRKKAHAQAEA